MTDFEWKLNHTQKLIENALLMSKNPAVLLSGGKESVILHSLVPLNIMRIFFHDEVQLERLGFMKELFLREPFHLLNFLPTYRVFVPTEEGVDLVNIYYLKNRVVLEVAVSPVHSDELCAFEWMQFPVRQSSEFAFDCLIAGGKATDAHSFFGNPYKPDYFLKDIRIQNPLFDWTTEEVWDFIKQKELLYDVERYDQGSQAHPDSLGCCTRCLSYEKKVWCPKLQRELLGRGQSWGDWPLAAERKRTD